MGATRASLADHQIVHNERQFIISMTIRQYDILQVWLCNFYGFNL